MCECGWEGAWRGEKCQLYIHFNLFICQRLENYVFGTKFSDTISWKIKKGGTNTFLSTNMRLLYYKLTKIWAFWYMLIKTIFYNCGLKRMKSLTHFTHLRGVMADWKVQWDLIWIDPAPESWIKVVGMLHILYVLIIDLFVTVLGG